jgi:hypothetical protein
MEDQVQEATATEDNEPLTLAFECDADLDFSARLSGNREEAQVVVSDETYELDLTAREGGDRVYTNEDGVRLTVGDQDAHLRIPGDPDLDAAILPCFRHNAVRLQLHALAYNLANFLRTLALPEEVEHWSLMTLREKLIKIGARIVRHGRYVVFQLAKVAVPRALFAEILRRIDRLRPKPLRA